MKKTAVIAGATGLVGNYLLFKLLACADYERVVSLVRRSMHLKHPKLDERIVNFEALTHADLAGATDVFCCLGTTRSQAGSAEAFRKVDLELPLQLGRCAAVAGAERFLVVSSVGANAASGLLYLRTKGEMEAGLAALGFGQLFIFRPATLLGRRRSIRIGEWAGKALDLLLTPVLLLVPPLRKYKAVAAATVAEAMLQAAQSGPAGTHIYESDQIQGFS